MILADKSNWEIPEHKKYPQCFYCGRLADSWREIEPGRKVPVCGYAHTKEGKRVAR